MQAMVLQRPQTPLVLQTRDTPKPADGEVLVKVAACGVCRTDLHVVDGELTKPKLPIVPGHEIVGRVAEVGPGVTAFDGGYADHTIADARYCFAIPEAYSDVEAAPLLCAGLIGHRSLKMAGEAKNLGIYGFGAAAHIVAQVALYEGRNLFAFTRPGDEAAQAFARSLGASWTGGSDQPPPEELDAAILFAPVGSLVPAALRAVRKGGIVVCGGIHMSDIPAFPYEILWGERQVVSVANLTRHDAVEFLELAPKVPVKTHVEPFALSEANEALERLRDGRLTGAAVLVPEEAGANAA